VTTNAVSTLKPVKEKRRTVRTNILKGSRVNWQFGSRQEVSYIADLSLNGLFIEAAAPPEIGTVIDLFWEAPGKEMRARAIVRRAVPGRGMGVEFTEMGAEDMTRLLNLLRAAAEQEASKKTGHVDARAAASKPAEAPVSSSHPVKKSRDSQNVPVAPPPARLSERRSNLRHKVTALAEVVEIESGQTVKAHLGNLGRGGCFVKTDKPSAIGTAVNVRITTSAQSFRTQAKVVYSAPGKGMGLLFTGTEAEELRTLDSWLESAVETSWLESNRRRSQRIALAVKVQVMGRNSIGENFQERTLTVSVSPHGAMVVVSKRVDKGQQLVLRNLRTEAEMECTAVYVARAPNDHYEVGLSFVLPNRAFWGVVFPPADWSVRHPDAKGT
jgi:hypothetical protein